METQVVSSMRKLSLREDQDNDLASISGHNNNNIRTIINHGYPFLYANNKNSGTMMSRKNTLRNITSLTTSTSVYSPRSNNRGLYDTFHLAHFLEACALCHKPLGCNHDIFMYRGDTPYCSEECRQEQIEIDEAEEKNRNYKALRSKKDAKKSTATTITSASTSTSKSPNYPFHTETVAAA